MRRIERLPEAIHSSVRSGIVISDLTRIVEELVFNSLDAGATKVSVAVGVGSCYIKVVDNGSGITRDGLVHLGERYATSKIDPFGVMDGPGNLGFQGEALGSISDVSLLEVLTKARGMPNGYHKVMKGCKCLHLGINDERQDAGTTVIARDIFYNQPVRRKLIQSSPKKVLDSIKKCLLRIALVHLDVSFKVNDIDSEDELLSVGPSPSPLPILFNNFRIEISSSLTDLSASDGVLKLSGCISGPCDIFYPKAIQYVYINSRFICKGPIHKLLNQLAARFDSLNSWKLSSGTQKGKRNRCQICPLFILNLSCPRSHCDIITFGQSETSVEFKDWAPVLTFIESAITRTWNKNFSEEKYLPATYESGSRTLKTQDSWNSAGPPSAQMKNLSENCDKMPFLKKCLSSHGNPYDNVSMVKNNKREADFVCNTDYLSQSSDGILAHCGVAVRKDSSTHLSPSSHLAVEDHDFWRENDEQLKSTSCSEWGEMLQNMDCNTNYVSKGGHHFWRENDEQLRSTSCSEWGDMLRKIDCNTNYVSKGGHDFWRENDEQLRSTSCSEWGDMLRKIDCNTNYVSKGGHDFWRENDEQLKSSSCSEWGEMLRKFDFNTKDVSKGGVMSHDCLGSSDDTNVSQDLRRPFMRSCFFQRSILDGRTSFASDEEFEFGGNDFKIKQKCVEGDDRVVDEINNGFCEETVHHHGSPLFEASPFSARKSFREENHSPPETYRQVLKHGSSRHGSLSPERFHMTAEPRLGTKFNDDDFTEMGIPGSHFRFGGDAMYKHSTRAESEDCAAANNNTKESLQLEECSFMNLSADLRDCADHRREISEFDGFDVGNHCSSSPLIGFKKTDWSPLLSHGEESPTNFLMPSSNYKLQDDLEYKRPRSRNHETMSAIDIKKTSRRSNSAPPFYRGKKRFLALSDSSTLMSGKKSCTHSFLPGSSNLRFAPQCAEISNAKRSPTSFSNHLSPVPKSEVDVSFPKRQQLKRTLETIHIQDCKLQKTDQQTSASNIKPVECLTSREILDSAECGSKWRDDSLNIVGECLSRNYKDQDNILDISSGMLHLAGDSLIPKSIDKRSLEDAKVLNQVDKKFIAVVASGTLAIIDQHAADERIRLEELRAKVLSGEMKTITYLNAEQKLVMPEIGYQLLQNYAEQIQNWGWIINILSQDSKSFTKNLNVLHKHHTVATLLAVPCILGVNLTDVDLLGYLQQLADTDGSSTMPPAVNRILNNKSCRGAIMFGDSLVPSECSLIVEELKRTSLCFQCAHGRPTTVPLVKLDVLHNLIAKIGSGSQEESWHGLHHHRLSLERAKNRLDT